MDGRAPRWQMTTAMTEPRHVYLLADAKQKARIRQILSARSLASYMNDTKWRELCWGVDKLAFPPAFQINSLDTDVPEPRELPHTPAYHGDWARTPEACLGMHVEWMKIAPRCLRHDRARAAPAIDDCSIELRALLDRLRLLYIEQDGFIVLYGHR